MFSRCLFVVPAGFRIAKQLAPTGSDSVTLGGKLPGLDHARQLLQGQLV